MAQMTPKFDWTLELTHQEMRLVLLGLAGMLKGKEAEEAKALNDKLRKTRYQQIVNYAEALRVKEDEAE